MMDDPTLIFTTVLQSCDIAHYDHNQTVDPATANARDRAEHEQLYRRLRETATKIPKSHERQTDEQ